MEKSVSASFRTWERARIRHKHEQLGFLSWEVLWSFPNYCCSILTLAVGRRQLSYPSGQFRTKEGRCCGALEKPNQWLHKRCKELRFAIFVSSRRPTNSRHVSCRRFLMLVILAEKGYETYVTFSVPVVQNKRQLKNYDENEGKAICIVNSCTVCWVMLRTSDIMQNVEVSLLSSTEERATLQKNICQTSFVRYRKRYTWH